MCLELVLRGSPIHADSYIREFDSPFLRFYTTVQLIRMVSTTQPATYARIHASEASAASACSCMHACMNRRQFRTMMHQHACIWIMLQHT